MEWSRAKTNRVLPRKGTGHSKHPLRTTQEKTLHMDITRWSTPKSDWLYSLQPKIEKLYTVILREIQIKTLRHHACSVTKSRLTLFDLMDFMYPTRLCPWYFPGKDTGVFLPFPSPGELPNPGIGPSISCIGRRVLYKHWTIWEAPLRHHHTHIRRATMKINKRK